MVAVMVTYNIWQLCVNKLVGCFGNEMVCAKISLESEITWMLGHICDVPCMYLWSPGWFGRVSCALLLSASIKCVFRIISLRRTITDFNGRIYCEQLSRRHNFMQPQHLHSIKCAVAYYERQHRGIRKRNCLIFTEVLRRYLRSNNFISHCKSHSMHAKQPSKEKANVLKRNFEMDFVVCRAHWIREKRFFFRFRRLYYVRSLWVSCSFSCSYKNIHTYYTKKPPLTIFSKDFFLSISRREHEQEHIHCITSCDVISSMCVWWKCSSWRVYITRALYFEVVDFSTINLDEIN